MTEPRGTDRTNDEFLTQVVSAAPEIGSGVDAEQTTRAVLTALANAVSPGQIADLMDALPAGLAPEPTAVSGNAQKVDKPAFLGRIGAATGTSDPALVENHARAVLATLTRWASDSQISDTLDQLPVDLRELFDPPQG